MASDWERRGNIPQTQRALPASFKSWLGSWQEWGSVIFLFLTLEIAVYSIEQAQWIRPQPSLTVILILAVLTSWLLTRSRLPNVATHFLAVVLGAMVTVWQASNLLPPLETTSGVNQLIVTLTTTNPNEGTIHFATFLIFFTWIIGYVSTWFILRRQNAWVAVSLSAIAILVNLSNLTAKDYGYFFIYLLAAMLLLAQTNLARHFHRFKKQGINYPNRGIIYLITSVLCLSLLMVSVAWRTPEVQVNRLETLFSAKTSWIKDIEEHWINFVAAIPAKQSSISSRYQEELHFGGTFDLSNTVRFVITSEQPSYWRTRMYDIYTSKGWKSSPATEHELRKGIPGAEGEEFLDRNQLTYSVVTNVKTDILLTAGEFVSADTPAQLQTLTPLSFDIDLTNPYAGFSLPPDVWSLLPSLLTATEGQDKVPRLNEISQVLPEDLTLTSIGEERYPPTEAYYQLILDNGRQLKTIELTRMLTGATDVVTVTTPHFFKPNQRYTVTASVTSATIDDLSEAGEDYPRRVTDYYLQLPYTLTYPVRLLSETITEEAKTPYEKAVAIKDYLSQLRYNYNAKSEPPPRWLDGVEYFLFTKKSGDCVYFASAMAVMLRCVGVPSRVCAGYLPGDHRGGNFIVRARHYHAWPEVYFPGYGWVIFEVTPVTGGRPTGPPAPSDILDGVVEDETAGVVAGTTSYQWLAWIPFFAVVGVLLIVALRFAISRWLQRFTGVAYTSGIYARMCFLASLVKLQPEPQQTPMEYGTKLASAFPPQAEAFDNIVQAYQESRFSRRKELEPGQKQRLQKSWREVYNILLKRLFHIKQRP